MDIQRLKDNLARVMMHGDEVPLFFFSDLFMRHPEVRGLFPVTMDVTRDRLVEALGRIVADVDNHESLVPFLQGLGRDHRKFGAVPDHFAAVGTSLIAALRHFSGPTWSADLEADWKTAYGLVANVMIEAAAADEHVHPAWWEATIVGHELRSFDIAVLRLATSEPLPYRPGQSISLAPVKAIVEQLADLHDPPRPEAQANPARSRPRYQKILATAVRSGSSPMSWPGVATGASTKRSWRAPPEW